MAAVLALLTWGVATGALALLGQPLALTTGLGRSGAFRVAMWLGLLLATLLVLSLGLVAPLGSSQAAFVFGATVLICALITLVLRRRGWGSTQPRPVRGSIVLSPVRLMALAALGAAVIYLAVAVAGPVTNYDTGLYHFGAISYAHDYSTIPGLANLFSPFGYSNSLFPLAAFLGNGPWDGEGFRLINGLLVTLLAVDVCLRLLRSRLTIGTYVLLVSAGVALIPLVALSDFWVISPSSDPAVMILAFISLAYLSDAIQANDVRGPDTMVALVAGVLAVSMRPLMVFFVAAMIAALVVMWWKLRAIRQPQGKSGRSPGASWLLLLIVAIALAVVQVIRDYRLSGWLEYPLAIVSFNVPWKSANPTESQLSTLGYARDPAHMHEVTHGWGWISSWIVRLPTQWEFAIICVLLLGVLVTWLLVPAHMRTRMLRPTLLAAFPAAVTVVIWFLFTPPSFRFAWGPIFGLLTVAIGWGLFALTGIDGSRPTWVSRIPGLALALGAVAVLVVVGYSAVARLDLGGAVERHSWEVGPIRIPYSVTPVALPETSRATLASGLTIESPVPSDQCWARYPLCSPQAPMNLSLLGSNLQSGFMAK